MCATASSCQCQTGSTLVIALIILVVLTLLVLSGVNTSALGFRIASNMQQQREAAAAAQAAIDARLGNANYLNQPSLWVNDKETIAGYEVTIAPPKCIGIDTSQPTGKKYQEGVEPIPRYLWEYSAIARSAASGVEVTIVQGVTVETAIGAACPN